MRAETIQTYPTPATTPAANNDFFLRFTAGDEKGLTWLYNQYYHRLVRHGKDLLYDEFAVHTQVQEIFLKAWQFRRRLTDALHAYRFMRLNLRWNCYDYLNDHVAKTRKYITYTDNPEQYASAGDGQPEVEAAAHALAEAQLETVNKILPLLPAERQTIFALYFKEGLTHTQIARRFGSGTTTIHNELQKGVEYVKKVIGKEAGVSKWPARAPFDRLRVTASAAGAPPQVEYDNKESLQGAQWQIFKLRYEMKWSFEKIAQEMKIGQGEVQRLYVEAHKKLRGMRA